ncbi:replicative helicase loader/inhibitor [Paenibacillus sp. FJAT-26967]|uniref:replicative helicase loader/inhibitor n=1 Tax=Paenibacillus sp. FJAT-26967 TaxID=1729690 RepID=UPI00083989B7|nr:replicative helicase loader/inhibitor [Paenibacillus sp. FJAT-26967]
MNEVEVRKIFLVIDNTFTGFSYDDFKVKLWQSILKEIPFELAEKNLMEYILHPDHRFPPTPGFLARKPGHGREGRYIPDAAETRQMLDNRFIVRDANGQQRMIEPVPLPPELKERLSKLGTRHS